MTTPEFVPSTSALARGIDRTTTLLGLNCLTMAWFLVTGWKAKGDIPFVGLADLGENVSVVSFGVSIVLTIGSRMYARSWLPHVTGPVAPDGALHGMMTEWARRSPPFFMAFLLAPPIVLAALVASVDHSLINFLNYVWFLVLTPIGFFETLAAITVIIVERRNARKEPLSLPSWLSAISIASLCASVCSLYLLAMLQVTKGETVSMFMFHALAWVGAGVAVPTLALFPWLEELGVRRGFGRTSRDNLVWLMWRRRACRAAASPEVREVRGPYHAWGSE